MSDTSKSPTYILEAIVLKTLLHPTKAHHTGLAVSLIFE